MSVGGVRHIMLQRLGHLFYLAALGLKKNLLSTSFFYIKALNIELGRFKKIILFVLRLTHPTWFNKLTPSLYS